MVIADLSFPQKGLSVNAAINLDLASDMDVSLKYLTVDALVDLVARKGRGCALMKQDLSRAYRQIPVDIVDVLILGYQWRGDIWTLPYPCVWNQWPFCARRWQILFVIFWRMKASSLSTTEMTLVELRRGTWARAHTAYAALGDTLARAELGDLVKERVPPHVSMTFPGILSDSVRFSLSIDEERLSEIRELLDCWLARQQCSRNESQSLLGKLNFVADCGGGVLLWSTMGCQ